MRCRYQLQCLAILMASSLTGTAASAGTYVFDLPVAPQTLSDGGPALIVPFSPGIQFHSIESVTVDILGTQVDGWVRTVSRTPDPTLVVPSFPSIDLSPVLPPFQPHGNGLNDLPEPYPLRETIIERFVAPALGVGITAPDIYGIWKEGERDEQAGPNTWRASFAAGLYSVPRISSRSFDGFKDGVAEITLSSVLPLFSDWDTDHDILSPSAFHLDAVRVTIVGQAVPEPASVVVLVASVLFAGWWGGTCRREG
jgi:hypothetical protein